MILHSLTLFNFRQHADTTVEFSDRGVTGIIGENESGKSTLLEGVAWSLFGAAATRGTKGSLRWDRAPARRQAEATLEFSIAAGRYRVERTESNAELFEVHDGFETRLAEGTSAVDAYIPRVIGMSWREWSSTFLASQKDLAALAAMKPTERQTFIREVMGVARIDRALAACRKKSSELRQTLAGLTEGLGDRDPLVHEVAEAAHAEAEARVQLHGAHDDVATAAAAGREADRVLQVSTLGMDRHRAIVRRRDDAAAQASAATGELQRVDAEIVDAENAKARVAAREPELEKLPALRAERETLSVAAGRARERAQIETRARQTMDDLTFVRAQLATCDQAEAAFDAELLARTVDRFRAVESQLQAARDERVTAMEVAHAEARAAKEREQRADSRAGDLTDLGPGGACPTCAQALGDRWADVIEGFRAEARAALRESFMRTKAASALATETDREMELAVELETLRKEGEALRTGRAEAARAARDRPVAHARKQQLEQQLAALVHERKELQGPAADPVRLAAADREIEALAALDKALGNDRILAGRIQLLNRNRMSAAQRLADAESHIAQATEDLSGVPWTQAAHDAAVDACKRATSTLADAGREAAAATERVKAAASRKERASAALQAYDVRAERRVETEASLALHEHVARLLNDFRQLVAGTIRPELEEYVSGFVAMLTDGRHESVTLSDQFEVTVQKGGVAEEVVSGGMEDIAALALRLAISQMIARRGGHPLSLLILDEPFGSLDATRRAAVLGLIRRLSATFRQVLLVSHVEETKYAVDHAIEVEYDEAAGRSSVRQPVLRPAVAAEAA